MKKTISVLIILTLAALLTVAFTATAADAPQLVFEPISAKIVNEFRTENSMSYGRGIIVLIKVTAQAQTTLWSSDFALSAMVGKTETRLPCQAITSAVSSLEDDGVWLNNLLGAFGPGSSAPLKKGTRYFSAFFSDMNYQNPITDGMEITLLYRQPAAVKIKAVMEQEDEGFDMGIVDYEY